MRLRVPSFEDLLNSAERAAVHLELRDVYAADTESEEYQHWKKTGYRRDDEAAAAYWKPWVNLISGLVARGVSVRRARVVSEPVTEYIRYEHSGTPWIVRAGEQVRWLPRSRASELALPGNDFWLIDDKAVRFNLFSGDGKIIDPQYTENPKTVALCADAFEDVWKRAIPHENYEI
ncbi:hypothetical protein JJV70_17995 [Streptomyces sp. JJ66]|uniref:DUF6879 family protein n=1 Tax=Streptomyces sp. JJ66 TaxID=2803843 RepID=UPI001C59EF8D|nr:DUF6879 family protein [Streptomyces sp. JJ66]MBW1603960.1 hypothetical protein [Streptomyces sp. JJ66]